MAGDASELEVLKIRVGNLEKQYEGVVAEVKKITEHLSAVKYFLLGVIMVEGPQALHSILEIVGLGK